MGMTRHRLALKIVRAFPLVLNVHVCRVIVEFLSRSENVKSTEVCAFYNLTAIAS